MSRRRRGTALADRVVNQLVLPSRKSCSGAYKIADQRVGQFISLRHGRRPPKERVGSTFASSAIGRTDTFDEIA
jgi:hypothetical protein